MTALVLYVIVQASQCNLVYSVELVNNFSVCPATKHSEYAMKIMNECLLTLESGSLKKKDSPRKSFPFF